jgi:excisionase family DNA binding protein
MYVDIRNAAKKLDISETQVRRLIKRKKLKAINVSAGKKRKAYRIKETDLEEV